MHMTHDTQLYQADVESRRSRPSTRQHHSLQISEDSKKLYDTDDPIAVTGDDSHTPCKISNEKSSKRRRLVGEILEIELPAGKRYKVVKEEVVKETRLTENGVIDVQETKENDMKKDETEAFGSSSTCDRVTRRRKALSYIDPVSSSPNSLSTSRSKLTHSTIPEVSGSIPKLNETLFRNRPAWIPRRPIVNVLDDWFHGQLVWWNRFLANRKKTRGYSTGYHVGRVIDLESEWFPSVELSDTKKRLRLQASQLGRRSVFVQSLDDLRYMAIPPRAISPFPDSDPSRNLIILEGCRTNSAASFRGLLRAKMIERLRETVGEMNGLLEIELLNLFFHAQGDDPSCSDSEAQYLQTTNVWEVFETRKVKPGEPYDESSIMVPPILASMPSERRIAIPKLPKVAVIEPRPPRKPIVLRNGPGRPGRPRKRKSEEEPDNNDDDEDNEDLGFDLESASTYRSQRRRQLSSGGGGVDIISNELQPGTKRQRTASMDAEELTKWIELCSELCLTRKQLEFLLRGIPFTLLFSTTGIPLPEDIPQYSIQILKAFLKSAKAPLFASCQTSISALIGYHYQAANLFLHKLFKTIVLRIPIKTEESIDSVAPLLPLSPPLISPAQTSPILHSVVPLPNLLLDDQPALEPQQQHFESQVECVLAPLEHPSEPPLSFSSLSPQHDIVFCVDHGHVNLPTGDRSRTEQASAYFCCKPFSCVSYHHYPWSQLFQVDLNNMIYNNASSRPIDDISQSNYHTMEHQESPNSESEAEEKWPHVSCRRSTLLLVAYGSNMKLPYYALRLNQISAKRPSKAELQKAGEALLGSGLDKFSVNELERRLARLYDLKQVAQQLRSIFEDETNLICDSNGNITAKDIKYFESLWIEVLGKLK